MRHKLSIAVIAIAGALAGTSPAVAETSAMNDLEIAHAAYTAGNIDIRYAHMALALSENQAVREFAQTMIRDHSAVNRSAVALIQELDVTPQDNELSRALVRGAAAKRDEFRRLEGQAFDCAYATNELAYHQTVNTTVANDFIPNTTVAPLRDLLSDALQTFRVHERHAEHMVDALECDS